MGLSESRPEPLARLFIPWRCWLSCLSHSAGLPRFLDRSIHARCPQPPRKAQRVHAYWFPVDDRLHPSRRTGHFQIPNEAESGSLALRLTCLPIPRLHQMDCSHLVLAGLHVRTGNLHGEHLPVHKISQAYPGAPTKGSGLIRRVPGYKAGAAVLRVICSTAVRTCGSRFASTSSPFSTPTAWFRISCSKRLWIQSRSRIQSPTPG